MFYDGERVYDATGRNTMWTGNLSGGRKSAHYILWDQPFRDSEVLNSNKFSYSFPMRGYADHGYCGGGDWHVVPQDGRLVRVQNLSAMRHLWKNIDFYHSNLGWCTQDPIYTSLITYGHCRRNYNGITSVRVTSTPANTYTYVTGEEIDSYSASVPARTIPIPVQIGDRIEELTATRTSSGKDFTFSYTVQANDRDDDGVSVAKDSIT